MSVYRLLLDINCKWSFRQNPITKNSNVRKGNLHNRHILSYHTPKILMFRKAPFLKICDIYNRLAVKIRNLISVCHFVKI